MSVEIELPIIDVGELLKNPEDAIATVKEIGTACRDHGFFYIKNHGVDTEHFLDLSRGFFKLPRNVKDEMHIKKSKSAYRGYFGHSEEKTNFDSPTRDWKEGAYFSVDFPDDHPGVLAGKPFYGKNQWPAKDALPGFKEGMQRYFDQLGELGFVLMSAMARSLGLKSYFQEMFHSPNQQILLLHYPPLPEEHRKNNNVEYWGVGKHTDYGILTILLQDMIGGLQVYNKEGRWIEAPPIDGTFVVNLGSSLEVWTNGAFTARPHRVKPSVSKDRYSIPFFYGPNFNTEVSPVKLDKAIIDVKESQYTIDTEVPFLFKDYLEYKYTTQFKA